MDPRELKERLGPWDTGDGPLYVLMAEALARRIRDGELPPGIRLPAERRLAEALNVSRGTVVGAYARLREQGLIRSRQGSGTVVAGSSPTIPEVDAMSLGRLLDLHPARASWRSADVIDMTVAAWEDASDLPLEAFVPPQPLFSELLSTPGYYPAGVPQLRDAVAAYMTGRGVGTSADQVLITSGAHQAVTLLIRMTLGPGDPVIAEETTYPGAGDALRSVGARIHTAPIGPTGADVHALGRIIEEVEPRLVYLIPTVHNPTGRVMPADHRAEVVDLLCGRNTVLVDDESLVETLVEGTAPPPLASFAQDPDTISRVFTIGSASKSYWGGLRVGWIRGPAPAIAMLTRLKALTDLSSPVLSQLVCLRLLEGGEGLLDRRRERLRERMTVLTDALSRRLPEWTWRRPDGGMSLWVRLPDTDARRFADVAAQHGVNLVPGPVCSPTGGFTDHIRLSLGAPPERLEEAVRRLEEAWRVYRGISSGASTLEVVV